MQRRNASPAHREMVTMNWLATRLQVAAFNNNIPLAGCTWELDQSTNVCSLIIKGTDGKRAVKVFEKHELQKCAKDELARQELECTLLKMLRFFESGARASRPRRTV